MKFSLWVFAVLGLLAALVPLVPIEGGASASAARGEPEQEGQRNLVRVHDLTNFRLVGKHQLLDCGQCHLGGQLEGTPQQCEVCHWTRRQDDPYRLQLGTQCGDCHTPESWKRIRPGAWEHEKVTGFRLDGAHRTVECTACHGTRGLSPAVAQCSACHIEDFERAKAPDHVAAHFPGDCQICHLTAATWQGAKFDHAFWPLQGQHQSADCAACHRNGKFAGTSTLCVDCHRADYDRATNPDHKKAGFPTECAVCHGASAASWKGARFDHDQFFALKGKHKTADCAQCHTTGRFAGTPSTCIDCHRADYDRTTSPNHKQAGFPTECVSCHGAAATSWKGANFNHDRFFALKGKHKTADCAQCHQNGRFAGTPSNCIDCHRADYDRTTSPNHRQAGFSTDCASCHGTAATSWAGAGFDHDRFFALKGKHKTAACTQCHINGRFAGTPSTCIDCHRAEYDRTTSPNHRQASFSTDCASCHGTAAASWAGAGFDHDRFFALRGRHKTAACTACHANGRYAGTPSNCIDCHRAEYDRTTSPNHRQANFSTDCTQCHGNSATSWKGASFDHNRFFVLQGAHTRLDCQACHKNGYNLPKDCYGCHAANYNATRNPDHRAAGFPTTCESCHFPSHVAWNQARFSHAFPIDTGKHNGLPCSDCHRTSNYRVFSCIDCHEHEKPKTDDDHKDVAGYTYISQACYTCHPNGRKP